MADVRLDFYDLDAEAVPDVCMKCGAPSTVRPMKTFSWMPYWARFMPYWIGLAFMKRRRVPIPLCEQHKNHWTIRYLIGFGGLAVVLLLFIGGGVLAANDEGGPGGAFGVVCLIAGAVFGLAWLITLIVLSVTQINVFEITDDTITLRNVSPEFTRAYREMTRGGFDPDVEDVAREKWGKPSGRRAPDAGGSRRRPPELPPDDKYTR
jgi:hypothetical protein